MNNWDDPRLTAPASNALSRGPIIDPNMVPVPAPQPPRRWTPAKIIGLGLAGVGLLIVTVLAVYAFKRDRPATSVSSQ
ncbi:MAG TPA: hypothetical protein VFK47_07365, partial [Ktedonobacteraceae bacterium]|nr:hypothetical protein [Ktedonobacteraceae bacterium]